LMVALTCALAAFAATDTSFEGTYVGSVKTSGGNDLGAWVQVKDIGNSRVDLTIKVADNPSIPLPATVTWVSPNSFTIAPSVNVPFVVSGDGKATFAKAGDSWNVTGDGSGSFLSWDGSASGSGKKVSSDFIEPPLAIGGSTKAEAAPPAGPADALLVGAAVTEKQPEVADAEKAGAGAMSAAAVIAALILCLAMGASMPGSEFAELLTQEASGQ
jgi:hypothetical protein